MDDYGLVLFHTEKVQHEMNQLLEKSGNHFSLTMKETEEIFVERNRVLVKNHLLDFAVSTTFSLVEQLSQTMRRKQEFLDNLTQLHELFYYLRGIQTGDVEDEMILEKIMSAYEYYAGDLEYVIGIFEDFPDIKEVFPWEN